MNTAFTNPFPGICCFCCKKISRDNSDLHALELAIGNQFKAEKRRNEFFTGRSCAQIAMRTAQLPKLPVLKAPNRSPIWPFSIVGSITHGAGYAAAAISRHKTGIVGVGLDLEDLSREIKSNITKYVLTHSEIDKWLGGKAAVTREVRIIFSIKEAIYKCFFPLGKVNLGFHDAEVDEISDTHFKARLLRSPVSGTIKLPMHLQGILAIKHSIILAAIKAGVGDFTA
jgi:enterobactin synthetase component D